MPLRVNIRERGDNLKKLFEDAHDRASNVHAISEVIDLALERQHDSINYDRAHPDSAFEEVAGGWRFGSDHAHYFSLLDVDEEELADIIVNWIADGDLP
jgi:hypothetical protein